MDYKKIIDKYKEKPKYIKNGILAFIFGGIIGVIGQGMIELYQIFTSSEDARMLMTASLVFIASVLTAIGVYDRIGQVAGAGTIVPITGFANSMTSAALEYKNDGIILGIASNAFKLAGSVIIMGVITAFIVGLVSAVVSL